MAEAWERQAFHPRLLDNLHLSVIFRGIPSDAGGPDYQDAILSRGGMELLSGDIEFHVRASDWVHHGHHRDRRYNNVILHVVWHADDPDTVTQDGRAVPVLELGTNLQADVSSAAVQPGSLAPHPCIARLARIQPEVLAAGVRSLALDALRARADRLAAEATATSPSQALYGALLESMGYASNRQTFRALAEAAPYEWLMGIDPPRRCDVLLHVAGFVPSSAVPVPARLPATSWRLTRIRPGNHPARRIAGIATLLERFSPSLADGVIDATLRSDRPATVRKLLIAPVQGGTSIGAGRADEAAVSVILPFVLAMELQTEKIERLFLAYPSPPHTRWTRVMTGMLGEAGKPMVVRKAWQHQGLHALYHRQCRFERAGGCPVCS